MDRSSDRGSAEDTSALNARASASSPTRGSGSPSLADVHRSTIDSTSILPAVTASIGNVMPAPGGPLSPGKSSGLFSPSRRPLASPGKSSHSLLPMGAGAVVSSTTAASDGLPQVALIIPDDGSPSGNPSGVPALDSPDTFVKGQLQWEQDVAIADKKQAELAQMQWNLFREQMSSFSQDLMGIRAELRTVVGRQAELRHMMMVEETQRQEYSNKIDTALKNMQTQVEATERSLQAEVADRRDAKDRAARDSTFLEERLDKAMQDFRSQHSLLTQTLDSERQERLQGEDRRDERIRTMTAEVQRSLDGEISRIQQLFDEEARKRTAAAGQLQACTAKMDDVLHEKSSSEAALRKSIQDASDRLRGDLDSMSASLKNSISDETAKRKAENNVTSDFLQRLRTELNKEIADRVKGDEQAAIDIGQLRTELADTSRARREGEDRLTAELRESSKVISKAAADEEIARQVRQARQLVEQEARDRQASEEVSSQRLQELSSTLEEDRRDREAMSQRLQELAGTLETERRHREASEWKLQEAVDFESKKRSSEATSTSQWALNIDAFTQETGDQLRQLRQDFESQRSSLSSMSQSLQVEQTQRVKEAADLSDSLKKLAATLDGEVQDRKASQDNNVKLMHQHRDLALQEAQEHREANANLKLHWQNLEAAHELGKGEVQALSTAHERGLGELKGLAATTQGELGSLSQALSSALGNITQMREERADEAAKNEATSAYLQKRCAELRDALNAEVATRTAEIAEVVQKMEEERETRMNGLTDVALRVNAFSDELQARAQKQEAALQEHVNRVAEDIQVLEREKRMDQEQLTQSGPEVMLSEQLKTESSLIADQLSALSDALGLEAKMRSREIEDIRQEVLTEAQGRQRSLEELKYDVATLRQALDDEVTERSKMHAEIRQPVDRDLDVNRGAEGVEAYSEQLEALRASVYKELHEHNAGNAEAMRLAREARELAEKEIYETIRREKDDRERVAEAVAALEQAIAEESSARARQAALDEEERARALEGEARARQAALQVEASQRAQGDSDARAKVAEVLEEVKLCRNMVEEERRLRIETSEVSQETWKSMHEDEVHARVVATASLQQDLEDLRARAVFADPGAGSQRTDSEVEREVRIKLEKCKADVDDLRGTVEQDRKAREAAIQRMQTTLEEVFDKLNTCNTDIERLVNEAKQVFEQEAEHLWQALDSHTHDVDIGSAGGGASADKAPPPERKNPFMGQLSSSPEQPGPRQGSPVNASKANFAAIVKRVSVSPGRANRPGDTAPSTSRSAHGSPHQSPQGLNRQTAPVTGTTIYQGKGPPSNAGSASIDPPATYSPKSTATQRIEADEPGTSRTLMTGTGVTQPASPRSVPVTPKPEVMERLQKKLGNFPNQIKSIPSSDSVSGQSYPSFGGLSNRNVSSRDTSRQRDSLDRHESLSQAAMDTFNQRPASSRGDSLSVEPDRSAMAISSSRSAQSLPNGELKAGGSLAAGVGSSSNGPGSARPSDLSSRSEFRQPARSGHSPSPQIKASASSISITSGGASSARAPARPGGPGSGSPSPMKVSPPVTNMMARNSTASMDSANASTSMTRSGQGHTGKVPAALVAVTGSRPAATPNYNRGVGTPDHQVGKSPSNQSLPSYSWKGDRERKPGLQCGIAQYGRSSTVEPRPLSQNR